MKSILIIGIAWFITVFACERITQPRLGSQAFELRELTTLVTETYLQLSGWDRLADATLRVYRNGQVLWERALQPGDTVLYDSTLASARTYTYRAELWVGGQSLARSGSVTVTTMDTTSHDFEWEIIEFPSPFGSGALYDVAIINENDIWAVGEIYADSAQPWLPYNAVHWDGEKWEMKRIQFRYFCNQAETFPAPAKSILAFGPNNIYIASGSQLVHWNGERQNGLECIMVSVNKLWGTDRNNIYAVGALGKIAHYNGRTWQMIESGTDERGNDIWGLIHPDGSLMVYFAFSDSYKPGRHLLLKSDNNSFLQVTDWPDSIYIESVWTNNPYFLFACGSGVWRRTIRGWHEYSSLPNIFRERIRGSAMNNIFVVGHRSQILHFNGVRWYIHQFNQLLGIMEGLAVSKNSVYITSFNGRNAYIIKGTLIK